MVIEWLIKAASENIGKSFFHLTSQVTQYGCWTWKKNNTLIYQSANAEEDEKNGIHFFNFCFLIY